MTTPTRIRTLLIEDEEYDVRRVHNTLRPYAHLIQCDDLVSDGYTALELLRAHPGAFDVVIMDFQIAGGLMGERLITAIKTNDPSVQVIVVTKMTVNVADVEFANRLMTAGAFWYCTKYPGDIEAHIYQPTDFVLSILNAANKCRLERQQQISNRKLMRNVEAILGQKTMIGTSTMLRTLVEEVDRCARSDASVLITGSSGTGKELVATNIHYRSRRKLENFVAVNCGSIPHELVESELFGYVKGAFTGANTTKAGLFETASGGSLFLDEVSELPLAAQVKLLRVLQEGEIEKIGRTGRVAVDVRIIAASNKDLRIEVEERRFREDLFFRLNVLPVYVPSLRERPEDTVALLHHFLQSYAVDMGRQVPGLSAEGLRLLQAYTWPGNVRELMNVIQRLLLRVENVITEYDVREALGPHGQVSHTSDGLLIDFGGTGDLPSLREMERVFRERYLLFVRQQSQSDAEAAKRLGLAPPNYHRMCKELGIK
ncbi:MAG: sigma-54-dependent Fis family transcriptional regulator [Ignavibacteriae bacterium]|nr:sigma-54-dependent Fis family transcriptional regulator [Ignavibacteriota bacterium]